MKPNKIIMNSIGNTGGASGGTVRSSSEGRCMDVLDLYLLAAVLGFLGMSVTGRMFRGYLMIKAGYFPRFCP